MPFAATITHDSKVLPGVSFTLKRLGFGRRVDLDMQTLALRQRLRDLQDQYPPLNDLERELNRQASVARQKLKAVPDEEVQAVFDNELAPILKEFQEAATPADVKRRADLDMEFVAVDNLISPYWIRAGLVSIIGGEVDGMTADQLLDYGPPALAREIYEILAGEEKLAGLEAKNSQPPITSGAVVGGASRNTVAADVAPPVAVGT